MKRRAGRRNVVRWGTAAVSVLVLATIAGTQGQAVGAVPHTARVVVASAEGSGNDGGASHLAYIAHSRPGNPIKVRDLDTGDQWRAYRGKSSPQEVHLAGGGKVVAWSYYYDEPIDSNRIMLRRKGQLAVNVLRRHPRLFDFIDSFGFSPNGKKIAFVGRTAAGPKNLYTIDADGSDLKLRVRKVRGCLDNCGRTYWSPKGGQIAFYDERFDYDKSRFLVYHLGSEKVTKLPRDFFGWSANEKWIGVQTGDDPQRLVRQHPDGTDKTLIAKLDPPCGGVIEWGLDDMIAVDAQDVYLVDAFNGEQTKLDHSHCMDFSYAP